MDDLCRSCNRCADFPVVEDRGVGACIWKRLKRLEEEEGGEDCWKPSGVIYITDEVEVVG